MKKIGMALIMADMLLCLLLAAGSGFRRSQEGERAALSEAARERAQERQQEQQGQEQEVRRIAITFEDEGIIGNGVLTERAQESGSLCLCLFGLSCVMIRIGVLINVG